jgi:hypothetical protein
MFISSNEKSIINARIEFLEKKIRTLENSLSYAVAQMACMLPKEKKTKGWTWSEESKTEASSRMKKYWAEKKAKAGS